MRDDIRYKIWATDDFGLYIDLKGTLSEEDAEVLRKWDDNVQQLFLILYENYVKGKVDDEDYESMAEFITNDLFSQYERIEYIDPESEGGVAGDYILSYHKASSDELPGQIIVIDLDADDPEVFPGWIRDNYHVLSKADREAEEMEQAMWDAAWDSYDLTD